MMNHGSLFSGIGGFDLAAQWMGWNNVFHCEWMPFPRQVLNYHFPTSISYHDITKTDFTIHRGTIDVLTGGFPCQPYSVAGKRLGKEDERHLWPEMLRAIREIEPRFVVGENVRGLVNWNGGLVFDEVQTDLENAGYEVIPFILPACAVGAPHRRDRVWFVAHRNERSNGSSGTSGKTEGNGSQNNDEPESGRTEGQFNIGRGEFLRVDTDTNRESVIEETERGREISSQEREKIRNEYKTMGGTKNAFDTKMPRGDGQRITEQEQGQFNRFDCENIRAGFKFFPTQSPICGGDDGLPDKLDGITFSKWRNESIKAYGNAIVPQVAFEIFKAIENSLLNE